MKEDEFFDAVASVDIKAARKLCQLFYKAKYNPDYAREIHFVNPLKSAISPQDALEKMFVWSETPEGGSYWVNISSKLPKKEKRND